MNITPIQSDFTVGEVAPDVQYRSTLEARNRGLKTLRNMVTDARGPVLKRKGFRFLGKIGDPVIAFCPLTPTIIDNTNYFDGEADDAHYDPTRNKIYFSMTQTTGGQGNLTVLDLNDDSITDYAFDKSTRTGSWYGGGDKLWLSGWDPSVPAGTRTTRQIDLDTMTVDWTVTSGSLSVTFIAETQNKIWVHLADGGLQYYRTIDKATGGVTDIAPMPSGYVDDGVQPGAAVAIDDTHVLLPIKQRATFNIVFALVEENASQVLAGDIVGPHPMDALVGVVNWTGFGVTRLINGIVYLFSSDLPNTRKYITKMETDTTLIDHIWVDDDSEGGTTAWDVAGNTDVNNYAPETNSFYWLEGGYWNRWDIGTEETEFCLLGVPTDPPIQYANGFFYHHDNVGGVGGARVFYRTS